MRIPGFTGPLGAILRHVFPNVGEQNGQLIDGGGIDYSPGTLADWGVTPPNTVGAALDALASVKYRVSQNVSLIGPGATIVWDSTNFTSVKTGIFLIGIQTTCTPSAVASVNYTLRADGSNLGLLQSSLGSPGNFNQCTLIDIVPVSAGNPHTFGVQVGVSSGSVQIAAGGITLALLELGG